MKILFALVLAGCGSVSGPPLVDAFKLDITSLDVTPTSIALKRGLDGTKQLKAMATDSTNAMTDVSDRATWSSADPTIATVDEHGELSALRSGMTTVTAQFGTATGTTAVTITNPTIAVSQVSPPSITFLDAYASGDVAPLRTITGATTTLNFPWGLAVNDQELVVGDLNGNAIDVFPLNGSGDIAPTRRILGATTTLAQPYAVTVFNNEIYAASQSKVLVFPLNATGNVAPTRTITNAALNSIVTGLAVFNNELFVMMGNSSLLVFPVGANGDTPPTRTITGASTMLAGSYTLEISNGEIYVGGIEGTLAVHGLMSSGDVAPLRAISTNPNQINAAIGLKVIGDELYEINALAPPQISVFPKNASGPTVPIRQIAGPMSTIASTRQMVVF